MPTTLHHVFGDTGGHVKHLKAGLVRIGMNPDTLKLPKDTQITHVGDLIHKGPNSDLTVELVDEIMRVNPGQWTQLLGNHEFNYLPQGIQFWPDSITPETFHTLLRWVQNGQATVAQSFKQALLPGHEPAPLLITHAGLHARFWETALGGERRINRLAGRINELPPAHFALSGEILYGEDTENAFTPSPVWVTSKELWTSWESYPHPPVNQIHGHTNIWSPWEGSYVEMYSTPKMREASEVDKGTSFVTTRSGNEASPRVTISIDPGYEEQAWGQYQPCYTFYTE